ncbi:hypothetical protein [Actinoplanes sp. NPDC049316]|uniref:hypothetical protein n=1 Tax=Actinoplanes sp. NPDC049316 TaxID=3154727 RepID=UPI00341B5453
MRRRCGSGAAYYRTGALTSAGSWSPPSTTPGGWCWRSCSAAAKYDLDRHWRNARTHSVHDSLDWKYHHLGAYALADVLPPNHGQL